uniref:WAT1-related protein n=1 Tax=Kalanchoe fedtschenkoi TaxID=63787 RepID=A0A7N0ZWL7_KALFE
MASLLERCKPYIAMVCLQFGYAGMNIITKVSLNRGMSHYVLVVYRHAFATAAIAPFAFFLERKVRPKITLQIFIQIFVLGLLGPVIDQNFYYAGLKFTSPTFACAMSNMLPAMTFVMAVLCRMEKVHIKKLRCQAKVIGTVVTVLGAMLMTLYKGQVINFTSSHQTHLRSASTLSAAASPAAAIAAAASAAAADKDWLKGSIMLIIATLAWASFFILQAITMKRYPAHLSLTALVCFMGTLQSVAVTLVMEHKPSAWSIGWDMNLLAAAYAGIVSSSIAYYVQGLVMQKRGPVFVTAFSPLMMIIVAIMGIFIMTEKIYLGGVLGAVLIVMGLYSVLWGKHKECQEMEAELITLPKQNGHNLVTLQTIDENADIEMHKNEEFDNSKNIVVVTVGAPIQQSFSSSMVAPKP